MSGLSHPERPSPNSTGDPDRTAVWSGRTPDEPSPPRQLGEYTIVGPLGRGGMGMVYRAVQEKLKRPVALKLLAHERVVNPQCVARFLREMEAVGRFDHPHIVRAYDAGQVSGTYYLAMELVEGIDVARLVHRLGPLPVADACEIIRQAALGLQHAHENSLVHRDIKPSNLLLSTAGAVKVADLGLALSLGSSTVGVMTRSNQIVGTFDYMAPEQAEATHSVDIRADLYSLGCTLYHLLTGHAPFERPPYSSVAQKLHAHAYATPTPIDELRADLPIALSAIVKRLLEKRPENRYRTPDELADALLPLSTGTNLAALAQSATTGMAHADEYATGSTFADRLLDMPTNTLAETTRAARTLSRRRWWVLAAGGTGLAGAGLAASLTTGWRFWRGADAGDQSSGSHHDAPASRIPADDGADFQRQWVQALGQPPQDLVFPGYPGDGSYRFDARRSALEVVSSSVYLVKLGELSGKSALITLDLEQPRWTAYVGLFFGYRVEGAMARCWLLELIGGGSEKKPFTLEWKRVYIDPTSLDVVPLGGYAYEHASGLADGLPCRWRLRLGRGGLEHMQFGATSIGKFTQPQANVQFTPADYEAPWGLMQRMQITRISQPTVRLFT